MVSKNSRRHSSEVAEALRQVVAGEVDGSSLRRAQYSSDAGNYRVVPDAIVFPAETDDIVAATEVARSLGVPVTMRGGGTSVAGNAIGPGVVVDTSRHLNKIIEVDIEQRRAVVQPGVILADLQRRVARHGLRFGPDPSTQARATLGGMIGNNACGPHALAYGRTADNVIALDVVDGTGRRMSVERGLTQVPGLAALVRANLEVIRRELGRFDRQISGYSLEHLLPENGEDLAKALVGTEGTCASILTATVTLVPTSPAQQLLVLGYPDMATAADAVPALLAHAPMAIEGLDSRLVNAVRHVRGGEGVPELPDGAGWLMVHVAGADQPEALAAAHRLATDAGTTAIRVIPPGPEQVAMLRIREDGAGLAGRTPAGAQAWPGWEDAAVPPERLGEYLREFEALLADYGLSAMPFGHFGDGCVHVRIDLPLEHRPTVLHEFVTDAARLVARYGGSLSGEHGDGRARSELLPFIYSEPARALFRAFKHLFDPANLLNPGVIVSPAPITADLRRPAAPPVPARTGFAFQEDGGDFTRAVHRCVGVGRCRISTPDGSQFMCPSFQATQDEQHVTRGRARVLQEMLNGGLIREGWRSDEVHAALDLCLSCKACAADCPAGVDMARYKSEVLHRRYRRRPRPLTHYTLGWLPRWLGIGTLAPRLINALTQRRSLTRLLLLAGGMDARRRIPPLASVPFRRAAPARTGLGGVRGTVALWVDSFTDAFHPNAAQAAYRVLQAAGYRVVLPASSGCCGLTWITTGQLPTARRRLRRLVSTLAPYAQAGIPIVGLEPSCLAVLRSDLLELLPHDDRAPVVADAAVTLAQVLLRDDPALRIFGDRPLKGRSLVVQPHCHQHAVIGFNADVRLLETLGASATMLAGCCGMAGNFGMERGHYKMSAAVARQALLPTLETAGPDTLVLADGFSCRTQIADLAKRRSHHMAEVLEQLLPMSRVTPVGHPRRCEEQVGGEVRWS